MNRKVIAGILSIVFFSFAAMQFNDVDGWKWMIAYLVPAILFLLYFFQIKSNKTARVFVIICGCVALLYVPDFIKWIANGFPSIVETMQSEKPYVEFVREFFGLIIICGALIYYQKLIK